MFHSLLTTWFTLVHDWGYVGVFCLMALESSIVPIPSEIVMPPAAFWASQGKMDFWAVVLAGTVGSYFGSIANYFISKGLGAPIVERYGKYILISPDKFKLAQDWVERYGVAGIFIARLLPVVRHLISIPAGILRMPVWRFSAATAIGAFLWCWTLSWFGLQVIGDAPQLLSSPDALVAVIKAKLRWFVAAVLIFTILYAVVALFKRRSLSARRAD